MWIEALDDPKLTRLSLAERGAWWGLLKLAHRCEAGGKIVSGGVALDLNDIADALHIRNGEDRGAFESMIAEMKKRGSLSWKNDVLFVVNLEERQKVPPSSEREAVAQRQRDSRERKRGGLTGAGKHTEESRLETEYHTKLSLATQAKQKELQRELSKTEMQTLMDEIHKEVYGE